MSEAGARAWVERRFDVSRETLLRFDEFARQLAVESERQNLVSTASLTAVWARHIADSAQLLDHVPMDATTWLDIGSGAGFPGLIVVALWPGRVTLVEPRRLRVAFLEQAADILGVSHRVTVLRARVETLPHQSFDVISARACAPLHRLFAVAHGFSTQKTRWILPKGRGARSELAETTRAWQGNFRLEPSLTDPEAHIIVAEGVAPSRRRMV